MDFATIHSLIWVFYGFVWDFCGIEWITHGFSGMLTFNTPTSLRNRGIPIGDETRYLGSSNGGV
jgi:hypothetical protein